MSQPAGETGGLYPLLEDEMNRKDMTLGVDYVWRETNYGSAHRVTYVGTAIHQSPDYPYNDRTHLVLRATSDMYQAKAGNTFMVMTARGIREPWASLLERQEWNNQHTRKMNCIKLETRVFAERLFGDIGCLKLSTGSVKLTVTLEELFALGERFGAFGSGGSGSEKNETHPEWDELVEVDV